MRKLTILLILAITVSFVACSKIYGPVKELDALVKAKDEVLTHWAKEFDANATEAGVDNARKFFESKKADLTAKREALQKAPQGMNSDWMTKWFDGNASDGKVLDAIEQKMMAGGYDSPVLQKFKPLRKDFEAAAHGK